MPIKVRCKHCETVLTVSDKARGRAVKCRECGGRVQVGPRKQKARPKQRPAGPDDLYAGINLAGAEDRQRRICPSCTTPVSEDDVVCPKCGVDVETGVLSERERRRRSRNAPPSEEFYGDVWGNSWRFLKENWGYAMRTAFVWSLTGTMAICSVFILIWYVDTRAEELRNSGESMVEITEEYVLIDLRGSDDAYAVYDGKRYTKSSVTSDGTLRLPGPRMGAMLSPPAMFWGLILFVAMLGFGGWAWTLAVKVIETTMARETVINRFNIDLFGAMAMGFRSIFWPAVLLWPLLIVPVAIFAATGNQLVSGIIVGCIYLAAVLLFLPSALVHLTQKYTYRAWLPDFMGRDFAKTVVPTLYVSTLLLGMVLLIPLTATILLVVFGGGAFDMYVNQVETPLLVSMLPYDPEESGSFFQFTFYRLPLIGMIAFFLSFAVFGSLAFPTVFMMRVYGLFGYYFRPDLSLINEQTEGERVGFGPRLLAMLIDSILMTVMFGVAWLMGTYSTKLFGALYSFPEGIVLMISWGMTAAFTLGMWGIYFSTWESGQNRGTPGKAAIGIMILTNDDKVMTSQQALRRAAASLVTCLTLFAGFAMCAFHPQKSALHDILTKTKVIWRGEGEEA